MTQAHDLTDLSVSPDEWECSAFGKLQHDSGFSDDSFPGCDYRLPGAHGDYAVNIETTGRRSHEIGSFGSPWYKTRVRIEFVGDGEPSVFSGGWIYSAFPLTGD